MQSSIVSVRPGPVLRQRIADVMNGKAEGQDPPEEDEESSHLGRHTSASKRKVSSKSAKKEVPVRPGMFLEAVSKVLNLTAIEAAQFSGYVMISSSQFGKV
ncbi:hypothetical protein GOP47_0021203 [Adiantum capillus-veneris]|uniref:Uncharacterized protein n=1 Tax=Adiantum capillus-veneris TaxID=13818 RepID=A0A9D4UBM4_ADICA|nr:hypothetical protein GOP47_0021203 [Adiantum capillus-veneris]